MMSELKAGVDRPGGRRAALPPDQRSPHSTPATGVRPVFGEVSPGRGYKPSAEIRETLVPAGLVDPEPELSGEPRKPLQIGDVRPLDDRIIGYEEYQPGKWRPAGTIPADEYKLTKLVERNNQAPLYRWSREFPDKPTRHVYVRPLGHGKGWERAEKE